MSETQTPVTRRRFFRLATAYTWLIGIAAAVIGAVRSVVPSVLPDPSLRFKIGTDRNYTPGTVKEYPEEDVIVFCDEQGLFAISTICTHLGCIVMHTKDGFQCPCHGSRFAPDGKVVSGPAPRDLDWFKVERLPGGQLAVDRARLLARGTKLPVSTTDA
jgi:nitrite reductase/ring-hydroxylating ferredoxin subunit